MGCDAFADKNGEFIIEIRNYDTSEIIEVVKYKGNPKTRIAIEILKGTDR